MSFGYLSDLTFFGLFRIDLFTFFDFFSSNVLLPLGGMFISIFVGWKLDKKFLRDELSNHGTQHARSLHLIIFGLRYIAPTGIALIFLMGLGII